MPQLYLSLQVIKIVFVFEGLSCIYLYSTFRFHTSTITAYHILHLLSLLSQQQLSPRCPWALSRVHKNFLSPWEIHLNSYICTSLIQLDNSCTCSIQMKGGGQNIPTFDLNLVTASPYQPLKIPCLYPTLDMSGLLPCLLASVVLLLLLVLPVWFPKAVVRSPNKLCWILEL